MKYSREVVDLMAAFPDRRFRMGELVRAAMPSLGRRMRDLRREPHRFTPEQAGQVRRDRHAVREGVMQVLRALMDAGVVERQERDKRGGFATYWWKRQQ